MILSKKRRRLFVALTVIGSLALVASSLLPFFISFLY